MRPNIYPYPNTWKNPRIPNGDFSSFSTNQKCNFIIVSFRKVDLKMIYVPLKDFDGQSTRKNQIRLFFPVIYPEQLSSLYKGLQT